MDSETIQQIATEVVARLPFGDRYWLLLAVNVLVAATAGALVALVASYLRTRGQNLATVLIRRMSKIGVTNRLHRWKKSWRRGKIGIISGRTWDQAGAANVEPRFHAVGDPGRQASASA
jgi:hypothetical protein